MTCHFRYPACGAGHTIHLAVSQFITAESSMLYFDTNMKKAGGGGGGEWRRSVI